MDRRTQRATTEVSPTSPAAPPATELKLVKAAAACSRHDQQHGSVGSAYALTRAAAESSVAGPRPGSASCTSFAAPPATVLKLVKAAGARGRHQHGSGSASGPARAAVQISAAGPRPGSVSCTPSAAPPATELKQVKAAAATRGRHQHGSGHASAPARASAESSAAEPDPGLAVALLDAYDIEWIKRKLERLIAGGEPNEKVADSGAAAAAAAAEEDRRRKTAGGGFWVRQVAGVCGPNGGVAVAEPCAVGRRGLRRFVQ